MLFHMEIISCFSNLALIAKIKTCGRMSLLSWAAAMLGNGEHSLSYMLLWKINSSHNTAGWLCHVLTTFCRKPFYLQVCFILPGMGSESPNPFFPSNSMLLGEDAVACSAPAGAALLAAATWSTVRCFCAIEMSVLAQSYPLVFVLGKVLLDWIYLIFLHQLRNWTGYNWKK